MLKSTPQVFNISDLRGNPVECVKAALYDVGFNGVLAILHDALGDRSHDYSGVQELIRSCDQAIHEHCMARGDSDERTVQVAARYGVEMLHYRNS